MISFEGVVGSRSSSGPSFGPPGEAEVLALNPQRRAAILAATGWNDIFPGTLNIEVAEEAADGLLRCTPLILERGEDVKYPPQYSQIPKLRIGYLYFRAMIKSRDRVASALIRRAVNPLKTRLEVFADQRLRAALALSDGDLVVCEVD